MAARQRIVVPFNGHVIGEGFNSETVERVGTALDVPRIGEDPAASGQSASFKFQMLTSQGSLEKALNADAELEVRYGLYAVEQIAEIVGTGAYERHLGAIARF